MKRNGICIKDDNRNEEINKKFLQRMQPDYNLQPHLSFHPVSTKFSVLPIIDKRKQSEVPLPNYKTYDTTQNFYPGTSQPPFSGYSMNVNVESNLRNQFFALQNNPRSVYVPDSTSDLYNMYIPLNKENVPYKDLYNNQNFDYFNPNTYNIAQQIFHNSTRSQLKDKVKEPKFDCKNV